MTKLILDHLILNSIPNPIHLTRNNNQKNLLRVEINEDNVEKWEAKIRRKQLKINESWIEKDYCPSMGWKRNCVFIDCYRIEIQVGCEFKWQIMRVLMQMGPISSSKWWPNSPQPIQCISTLIDCTKLCSSINSLFLFSLTIIQNETLQFSCSVTFNFHTSPSTIIK